MYKEINIDNGYGQITKHIIQDNGNGQFTSFPSDENNPNYQAYLKWLEEGNQHLPADE